MKRTVRIELLNELQEIFRRTIPSAMIDFLVGFFRRIPLLIGRDISVELPDELALFDDPSPHYRQLTALRELGVVSSYYLESKLYDDEPYFYGALVRIAGRQRMGHSGYGKSLFSKDSAWGPAIGEAIERWSLEHFDVPRKQMTLLEVDEIQSRSGVLLTDIAGFSPTMRLQKKDTVPRRYDITTATTFICVTATELTTNKTVLLPLQWFSFPHASRETDRHYEPVLTPITSSGAATGYSRSEAELRGLLEVIERDAFMIHWNRGIVPRRISLESVSSPQCERIHRIVQRYGFDVRFLLLTTDVPTMVVQAVILDRSGVGPAVVCDSAAGTDLSHCMERAFLGAIGLRSYLRRKLKERVMVPEVERLTIETRALWWASIDRIQAIEPYVSGSIIPPKELDQMSNAVRSVKLPELLAWFRERSIPVFSKDISIPLVRTKTGLSTVMVKVPSFIPMHFNEWEHCNFGDRLQRMPEDLGLIATNCTAGLPHPYA